MPLTIKYLFYQILIIAPFIAGYAARKNFKNRRDFSKRLININLIFIEPLIAFWSILGLSLSEEMIFLPAGALALVLSGFAVGFLFASASKMKGIRKSVSMISSSLANHGYTMGGFICYLFLGEQGLGLAVLFISYFMPYIFLFIFPYAKIASGKSEYRGNIVKGFLLNFQNMPFYAIIVSLCLKLAGIKRPDINFPINELLMISIALYYFSLGLNFSFDGLRGTASANIFLVLIKFLIIPASVLMALSGVNIDHSIKTIILIQSFMPAAIYSVAASILFDLDSKFASGLFVVNTIIFITIVLPAMFLFRDYLLNF